MVFIETRVFERQLQDLKDDHLLSSEGYRKLQNAIIDETTRIDTIPGTGGLQKARWKTRAGGKSGGLRVIFYHVASREVCLMLLVYKKGRRDKLLPDERKKLKTLVQRELNNLR